MSVAEAVAHHPHRFVGFFMHNPSALDSDAALDRALNDYKMHAICLFPAMHGYRLDDEAVERVFRAAAAHGAAVFVHCGVLTVGIRKKLEPAEALHLLEDCASGLTYAFSRGVTHRDVKKTNILISAQGAAKLVDFGLAGLYGERQEHQDRGVQDKSR